MADLPAQAPRAAATSTSNLLEHLDVHGSGGGGAAGVGQGDDAAASIRADPDLSRITGTLRVNEFNNRQHVADKRASTLSVSDLRRVQNDARRNASAASAAAGASDGVAGRERNGAAERDAAGAGDGVFAVEGRPRAATTTTYELDPAHRKPFHVSAVEELFGPTLYDMFIGPSPLTDAEKRETVCCACSKASLWKYWRPIFLIGVAIVGLADFVSDILVLCTFAANNNTGRLYVGVFFVALAFLVQLVFVVVLHRKEPFLVRFFSAFFTFLQMPMLWAALETAQGSGAIGCCTSCTAVAPGKGHRSGENHRHRSMLDSLHYIKMIETVFEAFPQVMITAYTLLEDSEQVVIDPQSDDFYSQLPIYLISLVFSVSSIATTFTLLMSTNYKRWYIYVLGGLWVSSEVVVTVAVFATFFYAGDEANLIPVVLGVILISFLVRLAFVFWLADPTLRFYTKRKSRAKTRCVIFSFNLLIAFTLLLTSAWNLLPLKPTTTELRRRVFLVMLNLFKVIEIVVAMVVVASSGVLGKTFVADIETLILPVVIVSVFYSVFYWLCIFFATKKIDRVFETEEEYAAHMAVKHAATFG